jgi:NAD(P)-dependent dehydrogenase (short-subunit alcohol dehydrogenase family)
MTYQRLTGRRAIVTGAASGIGAASARRFHAEGAAVLAVDLPGRGLGERGAEWGVHVLEADVSAADAPAAIVSAALERLGGLDILFNNAGVAASVPAADMDDDAWDRVVSVNLRAVFRLCRAAIPALKESSAGRIVNTASVMAEGTDYGLAAYCAAKAGVAGLTRTLALELGKFGITANYLLPGAIRTGMTSGLWDARPDIAEIWAKKAALRRLGEPDDLAKAAAFLASDDAAFVTGHGLVVDGGLTLRI